MKVALPYAQAVFACATHSGLAAPWSTCLDVWASLAADPRVQQLLVDPRVSVADRLGLFAEALPAREAMAAIGAEATRFLQILADKKRLPELPNIADAFGVLERAAAGIYVVQAVAAQPLEPEAFAALERRLALRFPEARSFEWAWRWDPSLQAGVRLRIGDWQRDESLAARVDRLAQQMQCAS